MKERIDAAVEVKIQTILEEEKRLKLKAGTIQETSTESYKELTERLKQAENRILSAEDFNSIADNNKVVCFIIFIILVLFFYYFTYFSPSSHPTLVCFFPAVLSLLIQHFQQVLWVLKSLLSLAWAVDSWSLNH